MFGLLGGWILNGRVCRRRKPPRELALQLTMLRAILTLFGLMLCLSTTTQAGEAIITGPARTIDGDTIEIGGVSIRLKGIAAPERDEPGGSEATDAMRRMIGSQDVRCELTGERTHQRAVGYCSAGGRDLNGEMVRGGWALSCPGYSPRYVGLEPRAGTVQRAQYRLPDYCVRR